MYEAMTNSSPKTDSLVNSHSAKDAPLNGRLIEPDWSHLTQMVALHRATQSFHHQHYPSLFPAPDPDDNHRSYFGNYLKEKLGIDYVYANTLEINNGKLTGQVIHPVVDGQRKALLLNQIAEQQGIDPQQTIAVGDGANDLPMLSAAGLGIAFRAKPLVRESAKQSMNTHGLDSILYLLGYKDKDISR